MNTKKGDGIEAIADLQENLKVLMQASKSQTLSTRNRKKLEEDIKNIIGELSNFLNEFAPPSVKY